jgi:hypothetical protein
VKIKSLLIVFSGLISSIRKAWDTWRKRGKDKGAESLIRPTEKHAQASAYGSPKVKNSHDKKGRFGNRIKKIANYGDGYKSTSQPDEARRKKTKNRDKRFRARNKVAA